MAPFRSLNPVENPELLLHIVEDDDGCEIFAQYCSYHTIAFTRTVGLALISMSRQRVIDNGELFWKELESLGETTNPFLLSAALYRFICVTKPFERVKVGPGPLIHPIVAQHTNASAGLRLCYALGEAVYVFVRGLGSYHPFERYIYAQSVEVLEKGATMSARQIAGHFDMIFNGRLGFLSV